jgi:hypothetical protein
MKQERLLALLVLLGLMTAPVWAASTPILKPGDFIIGIDTDGQVSSSSYPAAENPPKLLDSNPATKYLNRGGAGSGFIVTPSLGMTLVQSFTLTTANDSASRDPTSWELYGTTNAIKSVDNSTGLAESWTLIDQGGLALPAARKTLGPVVTVNNMGGVYTSYKMMWPTNAGDSLLQVADAAFYPLPDGTGVNLLSPADPILAVEVGWQSRSPAAGPTGLSEGPKSAIDATTDWKYLNFGEENSGFIVTPSIGPSTLDSFQITTANDSPERDPTTWMLYGTNDPITSADNSAGTSETWKLICGGTVTLPADRNTLGPIVEICNQAEAYTSYRMLFTGVKDAAAANSMQIAEIQFYGVPEPATVCLLGLGCLALLRRRGQ